MKKLIYLFSALVFLSPFVYSTILGVPGSYATIQAAINASVNGDTVLVEPGTYYANINFRGKNIVVTSRYYITNDPATINATIINGSTPTHPDTASCVIISSGEDSTAVLQGFSLTGGAGTRWMDEHAAGLWREGGGILIQYSKPIIKDNIIFNNIVMNTSGVNGTGGGGIRIGDSYPRFYNNIVMNNTARYGAGIVLNYTGGEYYNNIICSNYGSLSFGAGSGIWINGQFNRPKTITNNTIVNNSSINGSAGVYGNGSVQGTFRNNIIWGNTSPSNVQVQGGLLTYNYCNIQQASVPGPGNINSDPLFNDSSYVLQSGSPCVDKGDSSTIYNDLPDPGNPSIAKYPSRGGLRNDIGAYGGPFARVLTNTVIGIEPVATELPWVFKLEQNYPNPFNPVTSIKFSIPVQSLVTLKIYDLLGKEISVLVNGNMNPGVYNADFDASGLASGVYFYRLNANDIVLTRKMILTK